jgi:hypothetical protein
VLKSPLPVPTPAVALTRLAQLLWDRAVVDSYQTDSQGIPFLTSYLVIVFIVT